MAIISIDGAKVAYEVHGQGEPLLLIHGIFCSRKQWNLQIEYFKNKYQVIACDLRGHGESSNTLTPYSVDLFTSDVIGLLDHLGVEQCICCGHSFGGLVAQELAISYPERVRGIILAETMYGASSTPWEAATAVFINMWLPQMFGIENYIQLIAQFFGMYTPGGAEYILQEAERHLGDEENQQNILKASLLFDSRWRLHKIQCPTLLVVGQYPHIPAIPWQNWEMYWRLPNAKLVYIARAGHMLFWDNPEDFNANIEQFMATLPK